ncbi:MAG: TIGR00730 family Rossman fold protein [Firmicutes bacterium]|nr:TIGR00730 family Rossman fold protein [Bacillota bacterium]
MNITVYLGSSEGKDASLKEAVRQLGTWIGESGNALVYGGSKIGLMGILAESVVEAGGKATGVEPQFFIDRVLQYDGLTELIVTEGMADRKAKMIELGDAFIAMPGGTGTLEEIAEIMSMVSLKHLDAPCILYNHKGYYDDLKKQLQKMIREGFSDSGRQSRIFFADDISQIIRILQEQNLK